MAQLPPTYRKSAKERDMSLAEIIASAAAREAAVGLSVATVNRNLGFIDQLIRQARSEGIRTEKLLDISDLRETDPQDAQDMPSPRRRTAATATAPRWRCCSRRSMPCRGCSEPRPLPSRRGGCGPDVERVRRIGIGSRISDRVRRIGRLSAFGISGCTVGLDRRWRARSRPGDRDRCTPRVKPAKFLLQDGLHFLGRATECDVEHEAGPGDLAQ